MILPDFTPEIVLDGRGAKIHNILRPALYIGAFLAGLYVASLVLFPSQYFAFDFQNANSNKNTFLDPRAEGGIALDHGRFPEKKPVSFFAPVTEKYSSAVIGLTLDPESDPPSSDQVSLQKSYRAFFYPEGEAQGFNDGSLLENDGSFYIVSKGQLRFFEAEALDRLGFSKNSFLPVDAAELRHNPLGKAVGPADSYPDGSLFEIAGAKYLLDEEKLRPFLSDNAFLSRYDPSRLIRKSEEFLENYPSSNAKVGFADGALISSPDSIFIVSGQEILPVDSEITFLSSGFFWEDVIPASSDELAFYEKGKLYTLNAPHPDGTIFSDPGEEAWYRVEKGQKRKLPSAKAALSWAKRTPVNVSGQSLEASASCRLQKNILPLRTYSCRISLENIQPFPGKDFRFETTAGTEIKVDTISARFIRDINYENFLFSAGTFFNRIKKHYAPAR